MAEQPLPIAKSLWRPPPPRSERLLKCRGHDDGRGLGLLLSGSPFCSLPGLSSSSSLLNGTAGSGYRSGRSRMTLMFAATSRR